MIGLTLIRIRLRASRKQPLQKLWKSCSTWFVMLISYECVDLDYSDMINRVKITIVCKSLKVASLYTFTQILYSTVQCTHILLSGTCFRDVMNSYAMMQ